jgi:hypothetical protein
MSAGFHQNALTGTMRESESDRGRHQQDKPARHGDYEYRHGPDRFS